MSNNKQKGERKAEPTEKPTISVQEAGRRGGTKTAETHGREFYEAIGKKGGQRIKELIELGRQVKEGQTPKKQKAVKE